MLYNREKLLSMKRVQRLFHLLLLLSKEEKRLLVSELIDDSHSKIGNYLLPLLRAESLNEMHKFEKEWRTKYKISPNTL